ncbi:serine/threonine-protein kinase [Streptomyces hawaiiensis]|uniref:non-specific serine/threonine protein kinase n=1 Tax=Streptomyces hawaiiensis TaxID=67305 RepID=A0A6G5RE85_9ACTN|nr:serine/threonine-protein kinase [Streptomyces hawaiiensis]QCD55892.1 serine/threonine protein kinase [Streptomyces hawaiiensis]
MVAGRYRLVESIGQGGMGRVWRAADEILDRQIAVKEMRIDGLDAEDSRTRRERTLREARATARIDHPNVVRVYDVVDEGERLWIVMELVAGRSLERILAETGPLSPGETARLGLGLVAALRQVHERGVLHRDIKPGNVLVEHADGMAGSARGNGNGSGQGRRVVLTDFGIAAIQDAKALTMVGMLVGSPDYMAPERISGRPQGPPSDVWSLGATLCAALGGRSPFSRDTTLATLHAVLYEEPELPATSGPLRDTLTSLLAKEPSARPDLEALETALRPVAFPAPTPTVAVGPREASTSPASPEREPEPEGVPDDESTPGPQPAAAPVLETTLGGQRPAPEPQSRAPLRTPPRESPAPAHLPPPRDPRRPAPVPEPHPDPHLTHTTPTKTSAKAQGPVSLTRAQAETERRPHPTPTPVPPGELPGPALPATPRPRTGAGRRRRTVLTTAAATLVTAGTVVGILLATSSGSPGGDDTPRAGSSASAPAATDDTTPSQPTPTPTVEGTTRPQTLPPGTHREAGGFAWATPDGWRRDVKTGAEVHYTSPDGAQELVGKSSLARGDLLETWQTSERNAHQGQDYRKIRLEETTFRGHPAVVWEYTFTLRGVHWHARLLGFNVTGKSYQVNTWYEDGIEQEALATYDKVKDSFTVL